MELSGEELISMYRKMVTIRTFEEKTSDLFFQGEIFGFFHLSAGQEAIPVGTCANLLPEDRITSNHRGHGHILAKGADPKLMFAELYGKKTGYCKGKGGSMHIADYSLGIIGANGIVGGGIPIAVGSALAQKMLETDSVTVCFFGDGASNQGTFHESLNLASIWKLPVIFVCENNQYGMCTMASSAVSVRDISERARGYGMPGITVDGNDVMAVYEAAHRAVEMARSGEGPTLIECKTYRFHPHAEGEEAFGWRYRSADEVEEWRKRCPIARLEKEFLSRGILSNQEMERIKEEVKKEIEEAAEYARKSSEAEPEDALLGLFVQSGGRG